MPTAPSLSVADLVREMESLVPPRLAKPWDNVGLLLGSLDRSLDGPVLLTIDLTEPVADEAVALRAAAVIAYHPVIFHPLKRITSRTSAERTLLKLAAARIGVYSPHTALDAVEGGVTDWLADGLLHPALDASHPERAAHAGADRRALRPARSLPFTQELKIVTFVPHDKAEQLRTALASIGAGIIGNYDYCSFSSGGHGTFRAGEHAHPAVGSAAPGNLESVPELRLEMVCSRAALPLAMEMLRQFHPYEEPAIDVYAREPLPARSAGAGRRITFDHPTPLAELARRLKSHLRVPRVEVYPALGACAADGADAACDKVLIERAAVVPGSGAELAQAAMQDACTLLVTGEMKHHEIRAATSAGMSVMLAGHTQTERGYLPTLARRLGAALPGVSCRLAERDRNPGPVLF